MGSRPEYTVLDKIEPECQLLNVCTYLYKSLFSLTLDLYVSTRFIFQNIYPFKLYHDVAGGASFLRKCLVKRIIMASNLPRRVTDELCFVNKSVVRLDFVIFLDHNILTSLETKRVVN